MKSSSRSSSRTRASSEPGERVRYEVVRVWYHQVHSVLPREALRVERTDGKVFDSFEEAGVHASRMRVGGEYTFAPMKVG